MASSRAGDDTGSQSRPKRGAVPPPPNSASVRRRPGRGTSGAGEIPPPTSAQAETIDLQPDGTPVDDGPPSPDSWGDTAAGRANPPTLALDDDRARLTPTEMGGLSGDRPLPGTLMRSSGTGKHRRTSSLGAPTDVPDDDEYEQARTMQSVRPAQPSTDFGRGRAIDLAPQKSEGPLPVGYDKYLMGDELGRGGVGIVQMATDRTLRRETAIKVLLRAHEERLRTGFIEEAQITGQLEHPNIVPVHEIGTDPVGRPYMAMKRVRGRTLGEEIYSAWKRVEKEGADLETERRGLIEMLVKACEGIAYAHDRGVIHRDLKPDNIMVGAFGEVLVMDWGLAKPFREDSEGNINDSVRTDRRHEEKFQTMQGAVLGTPEYMAPEQAAGQTDVLDDGADIYSIGGILYTILTNKLPYEGRSSLQVLSQVLEHKLEAPSKRTPDKQVPRELEAVVLKAMARRRRDRYATTVEMIEDLKRYLTGRALSAADYNPVQLLWKWAMRNKAVVGGAAATFLALLGGLIALIIVMNRAAVERLEAEAAAKQKSEQEFRDKAIAAGTTLFDEAAKELVLAIREEQFNPAAPQGYFRTRLPVMLKMSRALQTHPDSPADWKDQLSKLTREMQGNAEAVGDWAIARHIADSAGFWEAIDGDEWKSRVNEVDAAFLKQVEGDIERLDAALAAIAAAEARVPEQGGLAPGEFEERARALAGHSGREVTREIIRRLVTYPSEGVNKREIPSGMAATHRKPPTRLQRQFMINVLGRQGDTSTTIGEVSSVDLVIDGINIDLEKWSRLEEFRHWMMAGIRLETARPGVFATRDADIRSLILDRANVFDSDKTLQAATSRMRDGVMSEKGFAGAIADEAVTFLDIVQGKAEMPVPAEDRTEDPLLDAERFVRYSNWLADWVSESARSGARWTRVLLDRADPQEGRLKLSIRQQAFVLELLGLHGDTRPVDPDNPERNPQEILAYALDRPSDVDLSEDDPERAGVRGKEARTDWQRRRVNAVAAARALVRLPDPPADLAWRLHQRRTHAGALFIERTDVPFRMAPFTDWPEPNTTEQMVVRAAARLGRGEPAAALADAKAAGESDPRSVSAVTALGRALMMLPQDLGDREATDTIAPGNPDYAAAATQFDRAIRLLLRDRNVNQLTRVERTHLARLCVDHGEAMQADRKVEDAQRRYALALELDPQNAYAWYRSAHARTYTAEYNQGDDAKEYLAALNAAWSDANKAVELAPFNSDMRTLRGLIRGFIAYETRDEKHRKACRDDLEYGVRLAPDSPMAYFSRGMMTLILAKPGDNTSVNGLGDIMQTIRLDPTISHIIDNFADIIKLAGQDNSMQAFALLVEGMKRAEADKTDWVTPLIVAATWRRLGNEDQAMKFFGLAVDRSPWRFRLHCELMRRRYNRR